MGEDKDVKKIQGKASLVLATVSDTLRALVFRYLKSIRTGSSDLDQLHYSSVRVFFLFRVTNIKLEKTRIIPELCAIGNLYFCNTDYKYFVFHLFRLNGKYIFHHESQYGNLLHPAHHHHAAPVIVFGRHEHGRPNGRRRGKRSVRDPCGWNHS
ncbi:hypothetical protein NPIL_80051 [Nephila pilipes]|uniref:Uncharacterized protein n=1 Tax=Nephila pilipes TaxID=299642 RepID=A0A8X6Q3C0_NEPPI|nr:hypothetical protein NPIL_80051 [Nephila pilipes]